MEAKGPLLIACNHPNSFLDAVIIDILFDQPVWSLARGDVFVNRFVSSLLWFLKILPVYRTSEGVENLSDNYKTFQACIELFRRNGKVLIFSEGLSVNEWKLRPLKKGTARLAARCKEENIPLQILPVCINYSSFRSFGKNVILNFGTAFTTTDFDTNGTDGAYHTAFNKKLKEELERLVITVEETDMEKRKELFVMPPSPLVKTILFLPAIAGLLFHAPLYIPLKLFTAKKFGNSIHYDSVITGLLMITYPVYILTAAFVLLILTGNYAVLLLLLLGPFTAWAFVQIKKQIP